MDAKDEEVCKYPRRNEKMTRSVDTLKELYTVAVGVALVTAVDALAKENAIAPVFGSEHFLLFLVLVVTLIPFYHGAFRHMDDIYIFSEPAKDRPGPGVLLADYLLLMFEAGLLVWLAPSISNSVIFTKGFVFLLSVDICWAAVTLKFTPAARKAVLKWGTLNLVTVLILLFFSYWPCYAQPRASYLLVVAVVRSALDYSLSSKLYFPKDENPE